MTEDTHISKLGLSTRSFSGLAAYHIKKPDGSWQHEPLDTIGKLVKKTQNDLLRIPNIGRKSINEIIYVLDQHGFKLKNYKENIKLSKKISMKELNLRDYFAAKAMQADISNYTDSHQFGKDFWTTENVANRAYNMADAMMKAREE